MQKSQELQKVVNAVINFTKSKNFSIENLSVTLINVKSGETAGYQEEKLRYPASVVKLFWLVTMYSYFETGILQNPDRFSTDLYKMLKKSDNEAASHILDLITNTKSGSKLNPQEYQTWLYKRYSVNRFFQKAGYKDLSIGQKTFPIPSEHMYEPKGRDLQMRGNPNKPTRNKISTQQVARLMYEIFTERAISAEYSQNLQKWLTWDLSSSYWKNLDPNTGSFNPIRTFFGESLPTNIYFASKAGWTSSTRQEVAYISDGRTAYILAVFAEDRTYAQNWKIFPQISHLVFEHMTSYQ
ncbi:MAG: serine hydrolase [Chroococcidiopsis sp.]